MTRCIFTAPARPPPPQISLERIQNAPPLSASRLTSSSGPGPKTLKPSSSRNPDTSSASNLRCGLFSALLCLVLLLGFAAPNEAYAQTSCNVSDAITSATNAFNHHRDAANNGRSATAGAAYRVLITLDPDNLPAWEGSALIGRTRPTTTITESELRTINTSFTDTWTGWDAVYTALNCVEVGNLPGIVFDPAHLSWNESQGCGQFEYYGPSGNKITGSTPQERRQNALAANAPRQSGQFSTRGASMELPASAPGPTYRVRLTTKPSDTVKVNVHDPNDLIWWGNNTHRTLNRVFVGPDRGATNGRNGFGKPTLTFTPSNWHQWQTVKVKVACTDHFPDAVPLKHVVEAEQGIFGEDGLGNNILRRVNYGELDQSWTVWVRVKEAGPPVEISDLPPAGQTIALAEGATRDFKIRIGERMLPNGSSGRVSVHLYTEVPGNVLRATRRDGQPFADGTLHDTMVFTTSSREQWVRLVGVGVGDTRLVVSAERDFTWAHETRRHWSPTWPVTVGGGQGSPAQSAVVPTESIANLQVTAVDDASASVSWDAVAHATSYEVSWDANGSQTAVSGVESVTGTSATIRHEAQEAMTLTVTVTPEYVDSNGQVVQFPSLAGTATIDVGPSGESIDSNGGTNGGDRNSVRADSEAVYLPDPVAHWRFDNDADDDAGSSDGTVSGGAAFTANEDGSGVGSHALSLDGSDDHVNLSSHVSSFPLGDATRSVSGWFKADAGSQGQTFLSYGPNVAGKRFSIAADRTQAVVGVSGHAWGVNGLELQEGWHHIAVTYAGGDSDDILIYLDGELQSASTLAGSSQQLDTRTGPAVIGQNVSGVRHYAGSIDDVRLYDVALSAEQVLALFDEHPQTVLAEDNQDEPEPSDQGIEADEEEVDDEEADDVEVDLPDPVAHWDFDNDAVDGAGLSHGTVSGGAAFVANEDGEGVGSHALSLDGSNDYVDLDLHVSKFPLGDSTRSVTGWFRANAGSQGQTFFAYGPNVAGERFSIAADRTQAVVGVSGYAWGVRNLSLTDGWHHIAVTFAGGDAKVFSIYLDGVLQSSELLGGFRRELDTKLGPASIGRSATGTKHYAGSIDDVRLYDVELSAEQVRALFDEHPQL